VIDKKIIQELKRRRDLLVRKIERYRDYNYLGLDSFSDISLVDIPKLSSNNSVSYVQRLTFFIKQTAIKASSFACLPNSDLALGRNSLYSSKGTKIILSSNKEANASNSISESFDLERISFLLLKNSFPSTSGAKIFSSELNSIFTISPLEINALNSTLASITTSIHINPFFFNLSCMDALTCLDNKSASFSVNLDLETISRKFVNAADLFKSSEISSLTSSDQFTHDKRSIFDL